MKNEMIKLINMADTYFDTLVWSAGVRLISSGGIKV